MAASHQCETAGPVPPPSPGMSLEPGRGSPLFGDMYLIFQVQYCKHVVFPSVGRGVYRFCAGWVLNKLFSIKFCSRAYLLCLVVDTPRI